MLWPQHEEQTSRAGLACRLLGWAWQALLDCPELAPPGRAQTYITHLRLPVRAKCLQCMATRCERPALFVCARCLLQTYCGGAHCADSAAVHQAEGCARRALALPGVECAAGRGKGEKTPAGCVLLRCQYPNCRRAEARTLYECGLCGSTLYCSYLHQALDWQRHHRLCWTIAWGSAGQEHGGRPLAIACTEHDALRPPRAPDHTLPATTAYTRLQSSPPAPLRAKNAYTRQFSAK